MSKKGNNFSLSSSGHFLLLWGTVHAAPYNPGHTSKLIRE